MKKQHKWLAVCLLWLGCLAVGRSQPGGWSVSPLGYSYSMTIVAQIRLNGVSNPLLNNHLAAFVDGQIRGYAAPVKVNGEARYFLYLFSKVYKGENLYFRAFIGAEGKVYECLDPVEFRHHKALGKIAEPYQINLVLSERPLIYSLSEVDYAEGSCPGVVDLQSSDNYDQEGGALSYSIVGGADAARFSLQQQTGLLSWAMGFSPDFEAPADADGDNGYEVRIRVRDAQNNTDEQLVTVRVVKGTVPPALECPSDRTVSSSDDGVGSCGATSSDLSVAAGTLCESLSLSYTLSGATVKSGLGVVPFDQVFQKGETTVLYVRTGTGASQCSFRVSVEDDERPGIVCPGNLTRGMDVGQCTAVVSFGVAATDNCGASANQTLGPASGTAFPKGTTLISWKSTDGAGLTAVCNFTVTVVDNQPPVIACPANIARTTDPHLCSAGISYAAPVWSDNCVGASVERVSGGSSGTAFNKGVTVVAWKATDGAGLTASCSFTVTVTDGEVPTISCPQNQTKNADAGQCTAVATYSATATDNCSPAPVVSLQSGLSSGSAFPKGATTMTLRATDGSGLTKTCTFRVTVNDTQAPTISCPANQTISTSGSSCVSAAFAYSVTATDNCPSPAPALTRISGPASGSTLPRGSTTVVWRATDASANTKSCSFVVTVTDNVAPTMSCPGNMSVTAPPGQCNAQVIYTTPTATDNCALLSLYLQSGLASYSTFPQGVTTNIWRATDDSGVTKTCVFTVTVACGAGPSGAVETDRETMKGTPASQLGLILTPNPATAQVMIAVEGVDGHTSELTVRDAQGRTVWQAMLEGDQNVSSRSIALDLSGRNFSEGLYFVTLRSNGSTMTKRLVKAE